MNDLLAPLRKVLESRYEEVNALSKITAKINAGLILGDVLDQLYDSFKKIIPYDRISVALLVENSDLLRCIWVKSDSKQLKLGPGYSDFISSSGLRHVFESGKPRVINDLKEYLFNKPSSESTRLIVAEGMISSLTCPLLIHGKPLGFIFFSSKTPHAYDDAHVELFMQIAGELAGLIEKGRIYQKMSELNKTKHHFLGMAAHDLRGPLGSIRGYINLLKEEEAGPIKETQRYILDEINKSCDSMLTLLNEVLDVSSIESGHLELHKQPTDVDELLRDILQQQRLLARPKMIELKAGIEEGIPTVFLDTFRFRQVMINLISNAIKYAPLKSSVVVKAAFENGDLLVSVIDQGPGIPEQDLPKLFREFGRAQVSPTGGEKSTGLGLVIVKRIIEAHGGEVGVKSHVGTGSTFSLRIPVGVES